MKKKKRDHYSGIGGQAVIEGIMMKNKDRYSVAVRTPGGGINVAIEEYDSIAPLKILNKIPFIRGVFSFIDSLILGVRTLNYSASFYEEEDEREHKSEIGAGFDLGAKAVSVITVVISLAIAIALFMLLPYFLSQLIRRWIVNETVLALLEGVIRIIIFIAYLLAISCLKDIKRVFMYHGAEHKCINCIEHGLPLEVDNVAVSSKEHKRCGTSFIIIVMMISILFFMVIRVHHPLLRLLSRLILMPVIAGVSYEFLRLAGRSDNPVINLLSRPGLMMQKLTTYEPDDSMIEVAIRAVEAVFDWQTYEKETFPEGPDETGKVLLTKAAERHAGEVLS